MGKDRSADTFPEAVIFDMDGVIFDSERLYVSCCRQAGEEFGMPDAEELSIKCIGLTAEKTKKMFDDRYGRTAPTDLFWKRVSELFHEFSDSGRLPVKTGVYSIMEFLSEHSIPTALASSTASGKVKSELEQAGLLKYFDFIIGGDMVKNGKPDPEIFLKAVCALSADKQKCIIIEDSFNGVNAAYNAGIPVIMVPDMIPPDEEMISKALCVLPSLTEVREYLNKMIAE